MDIPAILTSLLEVVTTLLSFITGDPLLSLLLVACLIPVGMNIFKSIKRGTGATGT